MKRKQGISLIVLVITIIVMIILAAAIILSLNNAGIIGNANKAVAETNLAQMKELASMSWGTAYAEGSRTLAELTPEVMEDVENSIGVDELENYEITVGLKGVTVVTKTAVPENWQDSVTTILDGVPIPKGFVASKALGENTKDEGFVIYEGTEEVNDENVEEARRSRNQYVWIPVDDFGEFKRNHFRPEIEYELYNVPGTADVFWEILVDENNMPIANQDVTYASYISSATQNEVEAMYTSVKKYGGFYIARYEMGIDGNTVAGAATSEDKSTIYSQMNKVPFASTTKTDMIDVARGIYAADNSDYSVVSTLAYGVQWDSMLAWMQNRGLDLTNKVDYGNVLDATITVKDINEGAKFVTVSSLDYSLIVDQTKESGDGWLMTTGALKRANTYNVYDVNGNVGDYIMENYGVGSTRVGGSSYGDNKSFRSRSSIDGKGYRNFGGRVALYIK